MSKIVDNQIKKYIALKRAIKRQSEVLNETELFILNELKKSRDGIYSSKDYLAVLENLKREIFDNAKIESILNSVQLKKCKKTIYYNRLVTAKKS